ncbi:cobalamin biosynthesis protein [Phytoactinopolyspora halotolerans]|uniref:Cobalamin biosynthesis protein CobD n=1 Tax=Phytoactinopolyspora halotolerans TaxID=1981512 RepID=A0A6L9S020_9ACTN|nr:cobalamin biosynthesis protein [Phytoactinopolyspora halotolerans]NED98585.1 cobalamin biosynthesis protein [Phytoactinopolyspora halotolerans]
MTWATTTGLAAGAIADAIVGDPRRGHPVAGFGHVADRLERRWWTDSKVRGALYTGVAVGAPALAAALLDRMCAGGSRRPGSAPVRPLIRTTTVGAATWAVLGGKSLTREAALLGRSLDDGDIDAARRRLPHLCGRDPASLDADGLARATVESVAENTSDAVVAPLVWGAVGGLPGLVAYRAVNTLDAMVGHKSARHRNFGWASARLDDAANLLPARLSGLLTAASAPLVGGRPADALRAWRDDARRHPSPNAGVVEAAFAGALGRRLGGRTVYPYGVDERPLLGSGPETTVEDIPRAVRLSRAVQVGTLATVVAARLAVGTLVRRRDRLAHGALSDATIQTKRTRRRATTAPWASTQHTMPQLRGRRRQAAMRNGRRR